MNLPDGVLPQLWLWPANLGCAAALYIALRERPWLDLQGDGRMHVFMGSCVALMLLWNLEAGITPGLSFHHLGATMLTLMFGWRLALLGLTVVIFAAASNSGAGWEAFGLNVLVLGVLPVSISHGIYRLVDRRLPNTFFVYIFLCAFFGAGLAMAGSAFAAVSVLAVSGTYTLEHISYQYLPFIPLIVFPEAALNGMIMALLVGLRPQWVTTFDDERYINGK
jgi:uncharacterized membrane protein